MLPAHRLLGGSRRRVVTGPYLSARDLALEVALMWPQPVATEDVQVEWDGKLVTQLGTQLLAQGIGDQAAFVVQGTRVEVVGCGTSANKPWWQFW